MMLQEIIFAHTASNQHRYIGRAELQIADNKTDLAHPYAEDYEDALLLDIFDMGTGQLVRPYGIVFPYEIRCELEAAAIAHFKSPPSLGMQAEITEGYKLLVAEYLIERNAGHKTGAQNP